MTGGSLTLTYDPLGRLRQTIAGATTDFLYAGDRLIAEYNGATLLRRYAHGPSVDEPIVWYEGATLTTKRWLHPDERGSIVAWTNASAVATVYKYGAYGEPAGGDFTGSRFRYTGQIALPEVSLYHYKARVYDPVLGRFLQTDPIGYKDDFNLYAYVYNDPLNKTDATGECPWCIGAIIGAAVDVGIQVTANMASGQGLGDAISNIDTTSVLVSAALGAVGNIGGGKALTTIARGLSNQTKGKIGEAVSRVGIAARGEKILTRGERAGNVGELGQLTGRAKNARPDFVVKKADGSTGVVEAKFGESGLTPAQSELRKPVGDDAFKVSRTSYEDVRASGAATGSVAGGVAGNCATGAPGPCKRQ